MFLSLTYTFYRSTGILKSYGINKTTALSLENYCGRPLTDDADMDDVSQEYWTFYKSIVFVLTVVSTVGEYLSLSLSL